MERVYESSDEVISCLINNKDHFWCHHCDRSLFFPNTCRDHAVVEVEEEGEEE